MNDPRLVNAVSEVKKALKWLLLSGGALTLLNGLFTALSSLQSGKTTLRDFIIGEIFAIAFMIVNTAIYFIGQYKIPTE